MASAYAGFPTRMEVKTTAGGTVLERTDFTWAGVYPYVGTAVTTIDVGTAFEKQVKQEQVQDRSGAVLQSKQYAFGNLTTPVRTFQQSYNKMRPASSSVTNGTQTITLLQNTFDGGYLQPRSGLGQFDSAYYTLPASGRFNITQSQSPGKTVNIEYDVAGQVTTANDGNGHTVSYTPSTANNYAVPASISVNTSYTENFSYNSFLGVTSTTGPNGASAAISYTSYGWPASSTSPHGAQTTYQYGFNPTTRKATTNGKWVKTTLDGLGRTIKAETGYATTTVSVIDTEYDSCACSPIGKVKRESLPHAPGAAVYWTTYNYDALGRTVSVVQPDGSGTSSYLYEGDSTKVTDAAGKWKKYVRDSLGNLVKVIEPNPEGGADYETMYSYDLLGHLTTVTMPRGPVTQTRTFAYDAATQRLTSTTHPESGTANFYYNADGTLDSQIDAKNQKLKYVYDAKARPIRVDRHPVSTGGADACQTTSIAYSQTGDLFWQNVAERLSSIGYTVGCGTATPYTVTESFSYTSAGLTAKKRMRIQRAGATARDLVASYTFDNEGEMTSVEYPSSDVNNAGTWSVAAGRKYTYSFDSMGRPNKLTDNDPTRAVDWVKDVQYAASGKLSQIRVLATKGASLLQDVYYLEARSFNNLLQLTRLTTTNENTSTAVMDMEYRYSATQNNGRITQQKDWVSGEEVTFQYDSLQRLIAAVTTGPEWGLSFTYDGFNNRSASTVTKGSAPASNMLVDQATNRLSGSGFGYDLNGNLTSMPGQSGLTYDMHNRLSSAAGESYGYGASNERVYRKEAGGAEEFHFHGADGKRLVKYAPTLAAGTLYLTSTQDRIFFRGRLIKSVDGVVVSDRSGSVRSGGKRYFPYGEEQSATSNDKEKFGGYLRDSATGFDYAEQRYYASQHGRFNSPDPYLGSASLRDPGSWNRYTFGLSDPVNFVDPNGLAAILGINCFDESECERVNEAASVAVFSNPPAQDSSDPGMPFATIDPVKPQPSGGLPPRPATNFLECLSSAPFSGIPWYKPLYCEPDWRNTIGRQDNGEVPESEGERRSRCYNNVSVASLEARQYAHDWIDSVLTTSTAPSLSPFDVPKIVRGVQQGAQGRIIEGLYGRAGGAAGGFVTTVVILAANAIKNPVVKPILRSIAHSAADAAILNAELEVTANLCDNNARYGLAP